MPDITCRICGEPWDTFGAVSGEGNLNKEEYRQLIAGQGCPSCGGQPFCRCSHAKAAHSGFLRSAGGCTGFAGGGCEHLCEEYDAFDIRYEAYASLANSGEDLEAWERLS